MRRGALERELSAVAGFKEPRIEFEQYPTPADIAAHLIHLAGTHGDLANTVVDLGTGTGMLALGAALSGASKIVGIDRDERALSSARENEHCVTPPVTPAWIRGDATRLPLCLDEPVTVLMNPPFGAQQGRAHADRAFLRATSDIATVSYSIHNDGSHAFIEAFADDHGGTVTHAFAVDLDLPRQFHFHTTDKRTIDAEAYRIEW
ncbi:METTL5 family protein [Halocatena marina]|uniref:METTL5 family protein n=1 Tax=Halocatena marina TaxID=2934937 RepID=A0ABD5YU96_9EURY|nr:METTL5 family protein [Halocatena marina]